MKRFSIVENGYDIDEVNRFIDIVIGRLEKLNAETIGELIYFFEKACAMSAELLEVNPFNQPGVEKYKTNMFELLGKPGYEKK